MSQIFAAKLFISFTLGAFPYECESSSQQKKVVNKFEYIAANSHAQAHSISSLAFADFLGTES